VNGFKEQKLSGGPVDDFNIAITKVWEKETFSWKVENPILVTRNGVLRQL
jgi:2,3-bisphosphoglycerate-dependent phosphoglycerate mutase